MWNYAYAMPGSVITRVEGFYTYNFFLEHADVALCSHAYDLATLRVPSSDLAELACDSPPPLRDTEVAAQDLYRQLEQLKPTFFEKDVLINDCSIPSSQPFVLPPYVMLEAFKIMDGEDAYYLLTPPSNRSVHEGGDILASPVYGRVLKSKLL